MRVISENGSASRHQSSKTSTRLARKLGAKQERARAGQRSLLASASLAVTGSCLLLLAISSTGSQQLHAFAHEATLYHHQGKLATREPRETLSDKSETNLSTNTDSDLPDAPASQFCQANTLGQRLAGQSQRQLDSTKKVFCFYDIQDDFRPQDMNPCLCTHVVYSYVAVRKNLSFIAGKKGKFQPASGEPDLGHLICDPC